MLGVRSCVSNDIRGRGQRGGVSQEGGRDSRRRRTHEDPIERIGLLQNRGQLLAPSGEVGGEKGRDLLFIRPFGRAKISLFLRVEKELLKAFDELEAAGESAVTVGQYLIVTPNLWISGACCTSHLPPMTTVSQRVGGSVQCSLMHTTAPHTALAQCANT